MNFIRISFRYLYGLLIIYTLVLGCNKPSYFSQIGIGDLGHFKGAEIGAKIGKVKSMITQSPGSEEKGTYLYYNFELNKQEYYEMQLSFDEMGLYEIHTDIYLAESEDVGRTCDEFKGYFNKKYGKPEGDEAGMTVWKITSSASNDIELSLVNESEEGKAGKLSISFLDRSY